MGASLTLYPVKHYRQMEMEAELAFRLDDDRELFRSIWNLPQTPLKTTFGFFRKSIETGRMEREERKVDDCGRLLHWVYVRDLMKLEPLIHPVDTRTKYAFDVMKELPEYWPIVLYWSV